MIDEIGIAGACLRVIVETVDNIDPKLFLAEIVCDGETIGCIENNGESLVLRRGIPARESLALEPGGWAEHWRPESG